MEIEKYWENVSLRHTYTDKKKESFEGRISGEDGKMARISACKTFIYILRC